MGSGTAGRVAGARRSRAHPQTMMKPQMNADERRQSQMLLDRRPRALICGSLSGYSI
jgi:hypothetical protein